MQDQNEAIYPSLPPEQKTKVDAVVDLMFSQNPPHNSHPLLVLLKNEQREQTARLLTGAK